MSLGQTMFIQFFIRGMHLKHQNMNVLNKPCLYDMDIKLSKLVNMPLKVGFLKTELVIFFFSTKFNV